MRILVLLAVAAGAAAGCGEEGDYLAERAQEVRELDLLEDVRIVKMSRAEFAARAEADAAEIDEVALAEYGETYGRLGFFDVDMDLRPIIAGSSSDFVGATYWDGTITLVGDAPADTVVHEWVHALQDQHFDIVEFDDYETSDGFLARRGQVEGDAVLAQWRFIMQEEVDADLDQVNWFSAFEYGRERSDEYLVTSPYPTLFLDYASFCYSYGVEYTAENLTGARFDDPNAARPGPYDWSLEDELFTVRPATTTAEVLALGDPDPIVPVGLDDVPPALADRYEVVDRDVLGQWYSFLLMLVVDRDPAAARALAAPWDGDLALFIRDLAVGAYATVWASAWDDDVAAQAVADATWALHGRTIDPDFEPERFALADDGEPVWVEVRGSVLVVIKNADPALMPQLADEAFGTPAARRVTRQRPSLAELIQSVHE